ncbi:MAG: fructose bisphosphate aldolase [Acidimicrobiia bacterium]|nr:fructose bisphosphate aldolase [Acidimicrobiia bacterium]
MNEQQLQKMQTEAGFIAALDQSGGSTPKALLAYGVAEDEYSGEEEMYAKVHEMRTRIMTSPAFTGDRVLGAILFENTMDRQVEGQDTGDYLWNEKGIIPFIKIDKGLADEENDAQVMKPMPDLDALLERSVAKNMFGTKMRSVIKMANQAGVDAVVAQQFEVGHQIIGHGLVPIIEPEIDIHSPEKAEAEAMLRDSLLENANALSSDQLIMLKLTLPEEDNFYSDLVAHPQIVRVVALSGGYSRDEANARLSRNNKMIASFSRALSEGLSAQQSDEEFNSMLDAAVQSIRDASAT